MNVKIVLEYDGTAYCGWQRQKNALSIQEVLERAISAITGEQTHVIGAAAQIEECMPWPGGKF